MKNDGGPANSQPYLRCPNCEAEIPATGAAGKSLREYAAIHLKVPQSGTDWLDDMISAAKRDEFALVALQALVAKAPLLDRDGEHGPKLDGEVLCQFRHDMAESAYDYANAMLAERARKIAE